MGKDMAVVFLPGEARVLSSAVKLRLVSPKARTSVGNGREIMGRELASCRRGY